MKWLLNVETWDKVIENSWQKWYRTKKFQETLDFWGIPEMFWIMKTDIRKKCVVTNVKYSEKNKINVLCILYNIVLWSQFISFINKAYFKSLISTDQWER